MILPKCIVTILQDESHQYEGKGTSFEKMIKKEVKKDTLFFIMKPCKGRRLYLILYGVKDIVKTSIFDISNKPEGLKKLS